MRTSRSIISNTLLAALFAASPTAAQAIVYDNTLTSLHLYRNAGTIPGGTIGNQVILAGSNRTITELSVYVYVEADTSVVLGLQPAFHGTETDPTPIGGQIWEGPIHQRSIAPFVETLVHLPIPAIAVPEEFTWTITFWLFAGQTTLVGPVSFWPRTEGSGPEFGYWRSTSGPGGWFYDGPAVRPFGARIKAVGPVPATSGWGLIVLVLLLLAAGCIALKRRTKEGVLHSSIPLTRSRRRFLGQRGALSALLVIWPYCSCTTPIFAQVVVGSQVRIDVNGGNFAACETSISASLGTSGEIVAGWIDWRDSPPNPPEQDEVLRIGVAVSNDSGDTWADFVMPLPAPFTGENNWDPFTAYDSRSNTLWVGGVSADHARIFLAAKKPGLPELYSPTWAYIQRGGEDVDKPWMAAGPRPGDPLSTNLYIAFPAGLIRSEDLGNTWSPLVPLANFEWGQLPRVDTAGILFIAYRNQATPDDTIDL